METSVMVTIGRIVGIVLALFFLYWLAEKINRLMDLPTIDEQCEAKIAKAKAKAKVQ